MAGGKQGSDVEQFFQKVQITDGCWNWTGAKLAAGYGGFKAGRAHRYAWEMAFGKVPVGLSILHTCDNRVCVKPSHLYPGTQADNMRDKSVRGRVYNARFSDDEVRAIRNLRGKIGGPVIGRMFGTHRSSIQQIWSGRTYKHVGG
jgi:hypothetical protein